jgi:hypothetical protein
VAENVVREQVLERLREICLGLPETSEPPREELVGIVEDAFAEVAPAALMQAALGADS